MIVFRQWKLLLYPVFKVILNIYILGYLTEEELDDYLSTPTTYKNYYTPINWCMNLVRQARQDNRLGTDLGVRDLLKV